MVRYEVLRVDVDMQSMQIKYSMDGLPDYYTRVSFPTPYTEESLHDLAKKQAMQAQMYWDKFLANPPLILNNPGGVTKPTYVEEAEGFDPGQNKLVEETIEEEDKIVIKYNIEPLTPFEKAVAIRHKRDALLQQTDNFALADRPMTEEMKNYRQALRDITDQEGFPEDIYWPILPLE